MVEEALKSDLCVYNQWIQNIKTMRGDGSKAMEDVIDVTSPLRLWRL